MTRRHLVPVLATAALAAVAAPATSSAEDRPVRIDVPVQLESADVVFNMDRLAFRGDFPVGMKAMHLVARRLRDAGVKAHIVGVFHGDAAYMTLSDRAYDAVRGVSTGNPYKQILAELASDGVQIEECGVSMREHGWTNGDLLPFVKVNTGAISRIVQLVQRGYVQIEP